MSDDCQIILYRNERFQSIADVYRFLGFRERFFGEDIELGEEKLSLESKVCEVFCDWITNCESFLRTEVDSLPDAILRPEVSHYWKQVFSPEQLNDSTITGWVICTVPYVHIPWAILCQAPNRFIRLSLRFRNVAQVNKFHLAREGEPPSNLVSAMVGNDLEEYAYHDVYFHVTSIYTALTTLTEGIDVQKTRMRQDFNGRPEGFYLKTSLDQAINNIAEIALQQATARLGIIAYLVPRYRLDDEFTGEELNDPEEWKRTVQQFRAPGSDFFVQTFDYLMGAEADLTTLLPRPGTCQFYVRSTRLAARFDTYPKCLITLDEDRVAEAVLVRYPELFDAWNEKRMFTDDA